MIGVISCERVKMDHRLADLRTNWMGKYVAITNRGVRNGEDESAAGVVVDIQPSGRKLGREGWPYWIILDWGYGMPWSEDTDIQEATR